MIWGRNLYDNYQKFLQFHLSVIIVIVIVTLIGSAFTQQHVFSLIQMIWINLIMDTCVSLALVNEVPHMEIMNRKPNNINDPLISTKMKKHLIGQAIYQLIVMLILIFNAENFIPEYSDSFDDEIKDKNLPRTHK